MDYGTVIACGGTILTVIGGVIGVAVKDAKRYGEIRESLVSIKKDIQYLKENGLSRLSESLDKCKSNKEKRLRKIELSFAKHFPKD